MSAPDSLSFYSLAEREFSAGTASASGDKTLISNQIYLPGKELEDIRDDLRAFGAGGRVVAQASMPLALAALKGPDAGSGDALAASLARASGIDVDDLRVAIVDRNAANLVTQGSGMAGAYAVGFSRKAIAARLADLSSVGVERAALYCRALNVLAALKARVATRQIDQPVLYLDILPAETHLYVAAADELADLGSVDSGSEAILEQVMAALGLKFPGSAAKLFYGDVYDFDDHAAKLVEAVVEKARGRLGSSKGKVPAPGYLYASGVPASRLALLGARLSEPLGLRPLQASANIEPQGADIPPYFNAAALGLAQMITSGGLDLSGPEQEWRPLLAAVPSGAKGAVAPAPAPAKTPEVPRPIAAAAAKTVQKQQPSVKKAKGPIPVPPAVTPAAAPLAPAAAPAPGATPKQATPPPAAAKQAARQQEPRKGKGMLIGIAIAAVAVVVGLAVVLGGGDEEAPPPEPVVETPPPPVAPPSEPEPEPEPVVEEPPPPPPQIGNLSLQTSPEGAEVFVNGEYRGLSPAAIFDLPSGSYTLEFRLDGFETSTVQAEVNTGETTRIHNVALEVLRGGVSITTEPEAVSYTITALGSDGGVRDESALSGTTPVDLEGFLPASYRVTFEREGWPGYSTEFTVRSGEATSVSFAYQPGTLEVNTNPAGATVSINGEPRGTTPADVGDLPEGRHEVLVELDGYEPESFAVDMPFGGSFSRSLNLLSLNRLVPPEELETLPQRAGGNTLELPADVLRNRSGVAYIRFLVGANGRPENVEILRSDIPEINDAVLAAARRWQFEPGTRKGFPLRTLVTIPVALSAARN